MHSIPETKTSVSSFAMIEIKPDSILEKQSSTPAKTVHQNENLLCFLTKFFLKLTFSTVFYYDFD